jgi:hypothetical protein
MHAAIVLLVLIRTDIGMVAGRIPGCGRFGRRSFILR